MRTHRNSFVLSTLAASLALNACARPPETVAVPSDAPHAHESVAAPAATAMPRILVHKSASCGCCGSWVRNEDDIGPVKARVGVPYGKGSCHTAEVGGYFIEGHVPAEDIKRLLAERPAAKGLTLPGMPAGSPGMEMPDGRIDPYTVELVNPDGSTAPFSRHGKTGS